MEVKEEEMQKFLKKNEKEAEKMMKGDPDKIEEKLHELEIKLKDIDLVGKHLASVPLLISMVRSYIKKEYTEIPVKSIVTTIGALLYVLSPIDLIPDAVPIAGYIDDAAIIGICIKAIGSDIEDYKKWRDGISEE